MTRATPPHLVEGGERGASVGGKPTWGGLCSGRRHERRCRCERGALRPDFDLYAVNWIGAVLRRGRLRYRAAAFLLRAAGCERLSPRGAPGRGDESGMATAASAPGRRAAKEARERAEARGRERNGDRRSHPSPGRAGVTSHSSGMASTASAPRHATAARGQRLWRASAEELWRALASYGELGGERPEAVASLGRRARPGWGDVALEWDGVHCKCAPARDGGKRPEAAASLGRRAMTSLGENARADASWMRNC
jgi:hypothetical protein